jgi:hypothetical protein
VYVALAEPLVSPIRVTVNVNGVLPLFPSALLASSAAIDSEASSFRIVPVPVPTAIVAPTGVRQHHGERLVRFNQRVAR